MFFIYFIVICNVCVKNPTKYLRLKPPTAAIRPCAPSDQTKVTSVIGERRTARSKEFETRLVSNSGVLAGVPRRAGEPSRLRVRPTSAGHDVNAAIRCAAGKSTLSRSHVESSACESPTRKYVNISPLP